MSQSTAQKPTTVERSAPRSQKPFHGILDAVIVDEQEIYESAGAILRSHAEAAWIWMVRDVAPDLIDSATDADDPAAASALNTAVPELLTRCHAILAQAREDGVYHNRLVAQFGGKEPLARLPVVLNALRCRTLLEKARGFGRAANSTQSDSALATALKAMPFSDPPVAALLMQAAVGEVASPGRLVAAGIRLAGSTDETALDRAGYAPVVDAVIAHAQNQIPIVGQTGPFADIDLVCRAVERFHRLVRAIASVVELSRTGRWSTAIGRLVKSMSERIEPRLRDVVMDVNAALRRHRDGTDRLDPDQLLAALNGVYLLAAVRECRDSLALNALFDQAWTRVGEALEAHVERILAAVRANPDEKASSERLGAAIKMAELRFGRDYADVLRRAKQAAEKRH